MEDIDTLIVKHGKDDYSLMMTGNNAAFLSSSHMYNHREGNHGTLTFQGITLENMLELAKSIRASVRSIQKGE